MAQPRRIPWVIAGGGLAVVAVVVVVVLTTSGSDTSSPENVAQAAVDTVNDKRPDDIRSLACAEVRGDTDWSVNLKGAVAEVRVQQVHHDLLPEADMKLAAKRVPRYFRRSFPRIPAGFSRFRRAWVKRG